MSSRKNRAPSKGKSALRRQRKTKPNFILPIVFGVSVLIVVLIVAVNSGDKNNTVSQNLPEEMEVKEHSALNPELEKKPAPKDLTKEISKTSKETPKEEIAYVSYNDSDNTPLAAQDKSDLQNLKLEIRQFILEKQWDDALSFIESYEGPHKEEISQMKEELTSARQNMERILKESNSVEQDSPRPEVQVSSTQSSDSSAVAKATEKEEPKKLQPLLISKDDTRGPNGFLYETDLDRRQAKPGASVSLVVHSKQVGLPQNVIVVWKDRSLVLSYSRLIKKLENKESRYYQERVEDAKKFLEENKERYALVPYAKAKLSLRRVGFTVSEVFFNETVTDEYKVSKTDRYKGFIISYDLERSLPTSVRIGC